MPGDGETGDPWATLEETLGRKEGVCRGRVEKDQVLLEDLQGDFQGSKAEAGQPGRAERSRKQSRAAYAAL